MGFAHLDGQTAWSVLSFVPPLMTDFFASFLLASILVGGLIACVVLAFSRTRAERIGFLSVIVIFLAMLLSFFWVWSCF